MPSRPTTPAAGQSTGVLRSSSVGRSRPGSIHPLEAFPKLESEESWVQKYGQASLSLENKASVARDHMANERTFLAWLRTSLSFISIGIGVTQLFRLEDKATKVNINNHVIDLNDDILAKGKSIVKYGKPLGSVFLVLGILTLLMGFVRFFQVQHMLTKNFYPASRLSIFALVLAILVVVLITFVMVIQTTV